MKNLLLLVTLIIGVSGCATTHQAWTEKSNKFQPDANKRVAIFPLYGDMTGAVADAITTEFMGMGYEVVERTNVNAVLREMKMDYSGVIDTTQAKEIARVTNADAIVFGSAKTTLDGGIYFLDLRFVDIKTGEILWSSNYINGESKSPRESITEISKSIQEKIKKMSSASAIDTRLQLSRRLSIAQNPTLPGQQYKKVALLPFSGTNIYGEGFAAYGALITDLMGNGVELVERKDLDSILKEQSAVESGLYRQVTEPKSAVAGRDVGAVSVSSSSYSRELSLTQKDLLEIGRITGADALLMGSFQPTLYQPFIFTMANLRVLDLATGKIAWSASYYNKLAFPDSYVLTVDWLSIAIAPLITSEDSDDFLRKYRVAIKNKKSMDSPIIEKLAPVKVR